MKLLTEKDNKLYSMYMKNRCKIPTVARFFKMTETEVVDWIVECDLPISWHLKNKFKLDSAYTKREKGKKPRNVEGYVQIRLGSKWIVEHRHVWQEYNGPILPGWVIHHINGVKSDNRIENLIALPRDRHTQNGIKNQAEMDRILDLENEVTDLENQLKKKQETIEIYEELVYDKRE